MSVSLHIIIMTTYPSAFSRWLLTLSMWAIGPSISFAQSNPSTPAQASASDDRLAAPTLVENATLAAAPNVPPPITRKVPARVIVKLEVREVVKTLADGVEYTFWTFGGNVPGLFIRVREGDLVEFHLNNHPSSKLPHNIDLHAVTGPGGGATSSFTAPGHSSIFSFTALNPGLFVYHCATAPVPMHVANGMYGLILVEPKEGLPPVDHEYYVMQGEVYTSGKNGESGMQYFDLNKLNDERPPYVVFNGAVGSLVGDQALTAQVGQKVRLFLGNGGPNLMSSFHVIGEIFDNVYQEGGTLITQHNVQTTAILPGGSAMVEFKVDVPGTFILADHALARAFNKGALGMLKVSGPENQRIYSGKEVDETYLGDASSAGSASRKEEAALIEKRKQVIANSPEIANITQEIQVQRGKQTFLSICFACHGQEGAGIPNVFPPLAGSDFLKADKDRAVRIVSKGLTGPVTVNGVTYNNAMPAQQLSDEQVADVLTYVMNSWGNNFGKVTVEDVRRVHSDLR
jgi:nitrite reductase (NO-forming)